MEKLRILLVERRESVTADRSLIVTHQFTEICSPFCSVLHSHPLLMSWFRGSKYYRCPFGNIFPNSNWVLWQPAGSIRQYPQISIKWWWMFMRKTGFSHEHSITLPIYSRWESSNIAAIAFQLYPMGSTHFTVYCIMLYYLSRKFCLLTETKCFINPLTPELNPSAQRCLTRFFTGDFASWTVHFVKTCICVKSQQIHQLFIQFINHVW
jgi:hypothetical protein